MYHWEFPTRTHLIFLLIKLKEGGHNFTLQSILENCWRQKDSPHQLLSRLAHRTGRARRAGPPAEPSVPGVDSPPHPQAVRSRARSIAAAGILTAPTPERRGGAVLLCSDVRPRSISAGPALFTGRPLLCPRWALCPLPVLEPITDPQSRSRRSPYRHSRHPAFVIR